VHDNCLDEIVLCGWEPLGFSPTILSQVMV